METTEPEKMKMPKLAMIILLIAALAVGGYLFYKFKYKALDKGEPASLGAQVADQIQNPAEKVPDVNPYDAKTNPFESAKVNPFKDVYKNPFK